MNLLRLLFVWGTDKCGNLCFQEPLSPRFPFLPVVRHVSQSQSMVLKEEPASPGGIWGCFGIVWANDSQSQKMPYVPGTFSNPQTLNSVENRYTGPMMPEISLWGQEIPVCSATDASHFCTVPECHDLLHHLGTSRNTFLSTEPPLCCLPYNRGYAGAFLEKCLLFLPLGVFWGLKDT